jgi:hypothetical protein
MEKLFGIPMGPLAVALVIVLAILLGALGALAARNRIFFKLGIRNVTRRRARTMSPSGRPTSSSPSVAPRSIRSYRSDRPPESSTSRSGCSRRSSTTCFATTT